MNTNYAESIFVALSRRWWALVVRGLAALGFGAIVILSRDANTFELGLPWCVYALTDGLFALSLGALNGVGDSRGKAWLLFEGLVGLIAGLMSLAWPATTGVVLLRIAFWGIVTGIAELAAASRLRRHIVGERLLGSSGVLSIALGVVLLASRAGEVDVRMVTLTLGGYAGVFGALLFALGLRVSLTRRAQDALAQANSTRPSLVSALSVGHEAGGD